MSDDRPFCNQCQEPLTDEELDYYKKNDLIKDLGCDYYCTTHWCACMPEITPWKYLIQCNSCGTAICRSCKSDTNYGGMFCSDCYEKLRL